MKYIGTIKLTTTNDNDNLLLKVREKEHEIRPDFRLDDLGTSFIIRELEIKANIECDIIIDENKVILEAGETISFKQPIRKLRCLKSGVDLIVNYAYGDLSSFDDDDCSHTCEPGAGGEGADLTDYYKKTETYNRVEVDTKIANVAGGGSVDLGNYYTKAEVDSKDNLKVDKVGGKSLVSDTEITRLATLKNYTHPDNSSTRHVTDTEKAAWNAKSNFDGNYNSLTNKPVVDVTKSYVDAELAKKANTTHLHSDLYYNKTEIDNKIANAGSGGTVDLSSYQTKSDNTLTTTAKTVVGAINENKSSLETIATRVTNIENSGGGGGITFRDVIDGEIFEISTTPTPTVNVTGVTLNKTTTTVNVGSTDTLVATIAPTNATNKNVTWSSSNAGIATVSNGVITGVANGSVTITVTTVDGSKTATCSVTVQTSVIAVTSVSLNKTTSTLTIPNTEQLTATILPSNASNKTLTWTSSNTNIATVNSSGLVTSVSSGSATITATTQDGGKTATCTYTISATTSTINNLYYKSDTLETPSGYAVYNQAYKGTKTVEVAGTIKYTCTDSGGGGIFKSNVDSYSKAQPWYNATHKYYVKCKTSSDGINYTLTSNIYTGFEVGTSAFNMSAIPYNASRWVKGCIIIDLTEIYGSGNEPTKTVCDSTYGDVWNV